LLATDRNNRLEVKPAAKEAAAEDGTRKNVFLICLLAIALLLKRHVAAH
jgi:hypothetical protein